MPSPHKRSFAAEELQRRKQKKQPLPWILLGVLGAVVILSLLYVFYGRQKEQPVPMKTATEVEVKPSIAVLPFENLSGDPEQEYFCDGVAEELINTLTRIRDLDVRARNSSFVFKGAHHDVRVIGDSLGVDYVIEGSVRRVGNDLRIAAQLIRVSDQNHVWSDTFDGSLEDVFDFQEQIAIAIVGELKQSINEEVERAIAKRTTNNIEAYQLYLKSEQANSELTLDYLHKAIELDPEFAYAYGLLAQSYAWFTDDYDSAKTYAEEALKRDPDLAIPYAALGRIYFYNLEFEAAEKNFKLALFKQPGYPFGHWAYAQYLRCIGRYREAVNHLKSAINADPFYPPYYGLLIASYSNLKMDDEAFATFEQGSRIFSDKPNIIMHLARLYNRRGEHEKALDVLKRVKNSNLTLHTSFTYAMMGDRENAMARFNDYAQTTTNFRRVYQAIISIWLGDTDEGLDLLEQVYEEDRRQLIFIKCDFEYDPVRDNPRFKALMKKMGLPED